MNCCQRHSSGGLIENFVHQLELFESLCMSSIVVRIVVVQIILRETEIQNFKIGIEESMK